MRSVLELFKTDFRHLLKTETVQKMLQDGRFVDFTIALHYDFDGNTKFLSCYLPKEICNSRACEGMIQQYGEILELFANNVEVAGGYFSEQPTNSKNLRFSGRIFIYHEEDFRDNIEPIRQLASTIGIEFKFRGPHYAKNVTASERRLAFISYDSRDKEKLVEPIVQGLYKLRCPVWYDDTAMMAGDSLRESIEKGLQECPKFVLILTPRYLRNKGWSRMEYDSAFNLEMLTKQKRIITVWYRVTPDVIRQYSPYLLTTRGIHAKKGIAHVVKELHRALTYQPRP